MSFAERLPDGKWKIPEGTAQSLCRGCYRTIYWALLRSGKKMPLDPDGVPHWATCPQAAKFRKLREERQPDAIQHHVWRNPTDGRTVREEAGKCTGAENA